MTRILVTGGTGFIGSHVVRSLMQRGHDLTVVVRQSSDFSRLQDVRRDLQTVEREALLAKGMLKTIGKQDVIVHLATVYGRANESSSQIVEANVAYPLRLLDLALSENVSLFVSTDSYSTKPSNLYSHLERYCLSKKQFLEWARVLKSGHEFKFVNMRLEHPYGPNDAVEKFTRYVIRSCLQNVPRLSLTAGAQRRDFIYVGDVADAYAAVIGNQPKTDWSEYEVGTGTALSVRDWVETVRRMTGGSTILGFGDLPLRQDEILVSAADTSALQGLGWTPATPLSTGLARTIEWERTMIASEAA